MSDPLDQLKQWRPSATDPAAFQHGIRRAHRRSQVRRATGVTTIMAILLGVLLWPATPQTSPDLWEVDEALALENQLSDEYLALSWAIDLEIDVSIPD